MNSCQQDLALELAAIRESGLYRQLRRLDSPSGTVVELEIRRLLNFSANDYLGLANDPITVGAALKALERYGVGAGASRLICGSLAPHHELETALAEFKRTEAALTFSSGYAAAIGTLGALLRSSDVVIIDRLVHACLVDAARLSGAKLRIFAHNDLEDLEQKLRWASQRRSVAGAGAKPRVLVVTESVFSMDGDQAPLREIVELKDRYDAWLMVDEAHATGIYGPRRAGLAEACGVGDRIEVQMGTLSKAIGSSGGFICGSNELIDLLVNRARSFIFSTAPTPASAAAATAAIRWIQSESGDARCRRLWQNVNCVRSGISERRSELVKRRSDGDCLTNAGAIVPLIVGDEQAALEAASQLRKAGIFIPAIRYPTVARGEARLRLTVSASHTEEQIAQLLAVLSSLNLRFEI